MSHFSGCLICSADIRYTDEENRLSCNFCGRSFQSNAICENGHYICDECHAADATEVIFRTCLDHSGTDPVAIATRIMHHPSVKMHGPEHHFLVPAVLLSCYYNQKSDPRLKQMKLVSARKRASHILGGFCGTHGTCGAGIGSGIFLSLILDSTPLKTTEWKLSNLLTAQALTTIASQGGPRCCKRDSYLAIQETVKYLKSELNITLTATTPECEFSERNKECLEEGCKFFVRRGT